MWEAIKAKLLEIGTTQLTGEDTAGYHSKSTAGPGIGRGSVFFNYEGHRVKLMPADDSPIVINHRGGGEAVLTLDGIELAGQLEKLDGHCPEQAYITISGSCIFRCKYCSVPDNAAPRKSVDEIVSLIKNTSGAAAVSLTSGVAISPEEEEAQTIKVLEAIKPLGLPVGVSIYPVTGTARRLYEAGAAEVKFNLETATPSLFKEMCPGMERDLIHTELDEAVRLFGKNHVFTNLIFGLGETDEEMNAAVDDLCSRGIIPTLRPLSPGGRVSGYARPSAERILALYKHQKEALAENGLDTRKAQTMCVACSGCDMVPGRD